MGAVGRGLIMIVIHDPAPAFPDCSMFIHGFVGARRTWDRESAEFCYDYQFILTKRACLARHAYHCELAND